MNEVVARIAARRTSADSCPSAACSTCGRIVHFAIEFLLLFQLPFKLFCPIFMQTS